MTQERVNATISMKVGLEPRELPALLNRHEGFQVYMEPKLALAWLCGQFLGEHFATANSPKARELHDWIRMYEPRVGWEAAHLMNDYLIPLMQQHKLPDIQVGDLRGGAAMSDGRSEDWLVDYVIEHAGLQGSAREGASGGARVYMREGVMPDCPELHEYARHLLGAITYFGASEEQQCTWDDAPISTIEIDE